MCGRYTLFKLELLLQSFPWLALPPGIRPRYNVAPTQPVPAVTNDRPDQLDLLRWGLVPSWAKEVSIGNRMINARAETLAEKPAFRTALQRRRCLIPADGFYEWRREPDGGKTPMFIRLQSGEPFMFAGLWDVWRSPEGEWIRSCTIITTSPNALIASLHDRMPAILPTDRCRQWLEGGPAALDLLKQPYPADQMVASPASECAGCDHAVSGYWHSAAKPSPRPARRR